MPSTVGIMSSGRMRLPLPVTNFWYSSAGDGDNKKVTFSWSNTPTNNDITGHRINIYDSSDEFLFSADSAGPSATSLEYTFPSNSTTYRARLFSKSDGGYASLGALTPASNRRLTITTGAVSYVQSGWGSEVGFTAGYKGQSEWAGQSEGSTTRSGDKAFDGNLTTYWASQSYAANFSTAASWISFYLGAGGVNRRINNLFVNLPTVNNPYNNQPFNHAGTITLDQYYNDTWNFTFLGATSTGEFLGVRYSQVPCNFVIAANTTGIYRFYMTNLGSNPTAFGDRQAVVAEVTGTYQDATSTNIAATANTITDG
jgi:hypothetical protein